MLHRSNNSKYYNSPHRKMIHVSNTTNQVQTICYTGLTISTTHMGRWYASNTTNQVQTICYTGLTILSIFKINNNPHGKMVNTYLTLIRFKQLATQV